MGGSNTFDHTHTDRGGRLPHAQYGGTVTTVTRAGLRALKQAAPTCSAFHNV
jgi:hypothetical protein